MRTVMDIYGEYRIMPNLRLHQLRVAAVGKLVCDNFAAPVKTHDVVLACLFHDMGNIVKSDLSVFPEFTKEGGLAHWKEVQKEFLEKYGDVAHQVNVAIAKEIPLSPGVIKLIDGVSFSNIKRTVENGSLEQKITEYADTRVGPYGVLSLHGRLTEARKRYVGRGKEYYSEEGFEELSTAAAELEDQIFSRARIAPENITDAAVEPLIEELRKYPVA